MKENHTDDTHVRQFTERYRRTFAKTLQICNLVPQEKWDWRPAETMRTFREVVRQIINNELVMTRGILKGEWDLEGSLDFASREEAMNFFRRLHEDVVAGLGLLDNEAFHERVDSPFTEERSDAHLGIGSETGPGTGTARAQLAFHMLEQELHHRGSLYVYLRLAGVEIPGMPTNEDVF